jgi:hypothetical protein
LLITPDELIHVTPPRSTAAIGSHPSSSPSATPGTAFRLMSRTPGANPVRRPLRSSPSEYSRPSANSRSNTPISAAISKNSTDTSSCTRPPSPIASPAIRYSGIAEIPKPPAIRESSASARISAPISMNASAASSVPAARIIDQRVARSPGSRPDQFAHHRQTLCGADADDHIAGEQRELRPRRRNRLAAADHRNDRRAGPGPVHPVADRGTGGR